MKKLSKILLLSVLSIFLVAGSAHAVAFTFGDGGVALQDVLDGITTAPVAGDSSVDVTTDALDDTIDSCWHTTATGASVSTMIIELASFADNNIFGVYDPTNPATKVELFAGSSVAGNQVTLSITALGDIHVNTVDTGIDFGTTWFGYYLDSSYYTGDIPTTGTNLVGGLWYSDTTLNSDGLDHMAAYQGTNTDTVEIPPWAAGLWTNNEYVLAFEDLDNNLSPWTDRDYTDMVVMVESVYPIPEPATMLLLGTGLVGLAAAGRKKRSKK